MPQHRSLIATLISGALLAGSVRAETPALASPPPTRMEDPQSVVDTGLAMAAHVRKELRIAREEGRTATAACLSDVLTRMDTAIKYGREHAHAAAKAKAAGDDETANNQMYAVRLRINAVRKAATDGGFCGVPTFVVDGKTTVIVTIDPEIARVGHAVLP